jgi:N-acetylmuramoyl-L-alanine amidase
MEVDVVARTIYGEARGQGILDRLAVGAVIRERVLRPGWWGRGWVGVCKLPWQFSCWNESDVNYQKLLSAHEDDRVVFHSCLAIARYVVNHMWERDLREMFGTNGPFPTHYHDRSINYPERSWGQNRTIVPVGWDSAFLFYTDIQGNPRRRS